ncbi:hypothetical protein TNCV_4700061 [Trichonephila clavipes]|nr:hypothetical protein TNCV_4700061 [Trichonephila clavipes]
MPSPGFEPRPYGTTVCVANHYTGWATVILYLGQMTRMIPELTHPTFLTSTPRHATLRSLSHVRFNGLELMTGQPRDRDYDHHINHE